MQYYTGNNLLKQNIMNVNEIPLPITECEVRNAITTLKARGHDNIQSELLKHRGERLIKIITT